MDKLQLKPLICSLESRQLTENVLNCLSTSTSASTETSNESVAIAGNTAAQGSDTLYELSYKASMKSLPATVKLLHDPLLDKAERMSLIRCLRDLDDPFSCQSLQIKFSFSIPSKRALSRIAESRAIVSAGAGCAYWEYLLQLRGVDVLAFDSNAAYPEGFRYTKVATGGPGLLRGQWGTQQHSHRALFLAWPDVDQASTFGFECVQSYVGDTVFHVGELFGHTTHANPWGQTTSQRCQLELGTTFRCVESIDLMRWPGHSDNLTVWKRVVGEADFSDAREDQAAAEYCLFKGENVKS
eukprot:m.79090 g.79090  ORF g.79090 m.79090 type:complete len:298 (+) comp25177_c2_seq3:286-1179(+)